MTPKEISYHKAAREFVKFHCEERRDAAVHILYNFTIKLAAEAKTLAHNAGLRGMDYQDAIVATWFYYVGITDVIPTPSNERINMLDEYFTVIEYPVDRRDIVRSAIDTLLNTQSPQNQIQEVVSDAIYSQFSQHNYIDNIIGIREGMNTNADDEIKLAFLHDLRQLFQKTKYYTVYALEHYAASREANYQILVKRIRKVDDGIRAAQRNAAKLNDVSSLSSKETEDLFKLAFRNYNHLVSVADTKASLLIKVNSIIISVVIGLVLEKIEKNADLLWPSIILLVVSSTTIFLSVLASRPQNNKVVGKGGAHTYQHFFFGSFDLIDRSFRHASWESYFNQLKDYFSSSREMVLLEVYKETYNVRKVLSKKFTYLSIAYSVFIIGLLVSICAFLLAIEIRGKQ